MTTFQLYASWNGLLAQWLPDACRTRRANLIWLLVGLYLGGAVQAGVIVKHWPLAAKLTSLTRRLSRFLANPAVQTDGWYEPVARQLLARGGPTPLTLILDATKVSAGHQLIMLALAHKKRALPVAWTWVDYARGSVPIPTQVALLQRVHGLLPAGQVVTLVADCGFASVPLMRQLTAWGWQYVLRQYSNTTVWPAGAADGQRLDSLVSAPGQPPVWLPAARLTRRWEYLTAVLACWQRGYDRPWLLATNLASATLTRQAYARRMGIEAMFGDFKQHGWDLEITHLRHTDRLSRLTLAVALLYVWLVLLGQRTVKAGWRRWLDRRERRDLSLFRLGADLLQRCLTLDRRPPVPFPSLVGGPSVR
jgi:hypothetical protein